MDLQHIFTEAVQFHSTGQFEQAKHLYKKLLQSLPDNVNILGNTGLVCRDLGELGEALLYCRKAVEQAPDDPTQHINLGAVYEAMGDDHQAGKCYDTALSLAPAHPKALNNKGKILHKQGMAEAALAYLEKAVEVEPDYPLALNNLGVLQSERGDFDSALFHLQRSCRLDPYNCETLYNLAGVYNCRQMRAEALAALKRVLELDPHHASARHMHAALSGIVTDTAPLEYVRETFDRYAGRFDEHIEDVLQYNVPRALAEMIDETLPDTRFGNCLDLGCGTGLAGGVLRKQCDRLTGVDLSAGMLARAREKKIYDHLECDEAYGFLRRNRTPFDLVVAADVLIYLGRADAFFQAIAANLAPGAVVAVSIEDFEGPEAFTLRCSGRYAHSPRSLQQSAKDCGLKELASRSSPIRKENDQWIPGHLYLFSRAGKNP